MDTAVNSPLRTLTLRNRLLPAVWIVLLLVELVNPARIWIGLLLGIGVLLGMNYAWARALRDGLHGYRRRRGAWVLAGDDMNETFVVENHSRATALWVEVLDQSQLAGYHPDWVAYVEPRGEQSYPRTAHCPRRGVFSLGPWRLRSSDPLGLFRVEVIYPAVESVVVYPRAMRLPDLRLPAGSSAGTARSQRRALQRTDTVAGVRPYQPGDAQHLVHWRQSARQQQLMVRQFDLEPVGDVWLALDLEAAAQAGEGASGTLEYAITLAASLAAEMLAGNRRVGLAAAGIHLPPHGGNGQLWRIFEALARAEAVPGYDLSRVLQTLRHAGQSGRGRTLLALTPACDVTWVAELADLAAHGNAGVAVLLDAAGFLPRHAPARVERQAAFTGLCGLLAAQSIPYQVFGSDFAFQPLAGITRTRTEWRTLSATGRVMAVQVEETV